MSERLYRPRALLRLTIPLPKGGGEFEAFTYDVPVLSARHVSNDHNHADTLAATVDWLDAGVDPRWIAGGTCEYYCGHVETGAELEPSDDTLRFVGRMVKPARSSKGDTLSVTLDFHDYTSFFLLAKPVATDGIPLFSETLEEAWRRLCDNVPGAWELFDNIELRGLSSTPVLGKAVAPRFRGKGRLHVQPGADAWSIWQQAVGSVGLVSYFDRDRLVITTTEDYYTGNAPPRLVWGRNLLDFTEERNNDRALRGVGITSFDPIAGEAIEAIWNPLAAVRQKLTRKTAAKGFQGRSRSKSKAIDEAKDADIFAVPGLADYDAALALAKRVYEERSRQELEGTAVTVDMTAPDANGDEFDLLALRSGDTLDVRFLDTEDSLFLRSFSSPQDRAAYLIERGYTEPVARIIAAHVDRMTDKSSLFYCKTVTTTLDSTPEGGSFRVEIAFANKIDPGGGTA